MLAGTNGCGKSSIAGAMLREHRADYFNPDEAARRIRAADPGIDPVEANSRAWLQGKRLLEKALSTRADYAFETTLGGNTMPSLLELASDRGFAVRIWYVGLEGPELHIARVLARVVAGGHDIPKAKIRERYDQSRKNLVRLLPKLTELAVFDNSVEGDPGAGGSPRPRLVLSMLDGRIVETCPVPEVPGWAKPLFVAALEAYQF